MYRDGSQLYTIASGCDMANGILLPARKLTPTATVPANFRRNWLKGLISVYSEEEEVLGSA